MFHFCDFFHETNQKKRKQKLESAQRRMEIIFNKTYIYEVIIHNDCQITHESHG